MTEQTETGQTLSRRHALNIVRNAADEYSVELYNHIAPSVSLEPDHEQELYEQSDAIGDALRVLGDADGTHQSRVETVIQAAQRWLETERESVIPTTDDPEARKQYEQQAGTVQGSIQYLKETEGLA